MSQNGKSDDIKNLHSLYASSPDAQNNPPPTIRSDRQKMFALDVNSQTDSSDDDSGYPRTSATSSSVGSRPMHEHKLCNADEITRDSSVTPPRRLSSAQLVYLPHAPPVSLMRQQSVPRKRSSELTELTNMCETLFSAYASPNKDDDEFDHLRASMPKLHYNKSKSYEDNSEGTAAEKIIWRERGGIWDVGEIPVEKNTSHAISIPQRDYEHERNISEYGSKPEAPRKPVDLSSFTSVCETLFESNATTEQEAELERIRMARRGSKQILLPRAISTLIHDEHPDADQQQQRRRANSFTKGEVAARKLSEGSEKSITPPNTTPTRKRSSAHYLPHAPSPLLSRQMSVPRKKSDEHMTELVNMVETLFSANATSDDDDENYVERMPMPGGRVRTSSQNTNDEQLEGIDAKKVMWREKESIWDPHLYPDEQPSSSSNTLTNIPAREYTFDRQMSVPKQSVCLSSFTDVVDTLYTTDAGELEELERLRAARAAATPVPVPKMVATLAQDNQSDEASVAPVERKISTSSHKSTSEDSSEMATIRKLAQNVAKRKLSTTSTRKYQAPQRTTPAFPVTPQPVVYIDTRPPEIKKDKVKSSWLKNVTKSAIKIAVKTKDKKDKNAPPEPQFNQCIRRAGSEYK